MPSMNHHLQFADLPEATAALPWAWDGAGWMTAGEGWRLRPIAAPWAVLPSGEFGGVREDGYWVAMLASQAFMEAADPPLASFIKSTGKTDRAGCFATTGPF